MKFFVCVLIGIAIVCFVYAVFRFCDWLEMNAPDWVEVCYKLICGGVVLGGFIWLMLNFVF